MKDIIFRLTKEKDYNEFVEEMIEDAKKTFKKEPEKGNIEENDKQIILTIHDIEL